MNLAELNPIVLLKSNLGGDYLGVFYKRVATVRARVTDYLIGGDFHLLIGEFLEDVKKEHLLDYDNHLLEEVLRCRTPLHERRSAAVDWSVPSV